MQKCGEREGVRSSTKDLSLRKRFDLEFCWRPPAAFTLASPSMLCRACLPFSLWRVIWRCTLRSNGRLAFCTLVGAFSGAMPPLIGWAAATNRLSPEAWMLYGILFLWQFPHFMAIAWMYRQDYARAGYAVLPNGPRAGRSMSWQALAPSLALLPFSAGTAVFAGLGRTGVFAVCALASVLVFYSARLALRRSNIEARRLLAVSIIYLPLTYFVLVIGGR